MLSYHISELEGERLEVRDRVPVWLRPQGGAQAPGEPIESWHQM